MAKFFILIPIIITGLFGYPQWQEAQTKQQILAATVQITMIVPQWTEGEQQAIEPLPVPPDEVRTMATVKEYIVAEGLGTVVQANGRPYLITHDHWSQLTTSAGSVQFRDAAGTLLAEMPLYKFKRLIVARDGGTMVLSAPDSLQDLAMAAMPESVAANENLWLVHRQEEQVLVSPVQRVAVDSKNGVAVWRLQGEAVVSGDSGGGVWMNGRLAAITWTAVMLENQTNGERQATDVSIAAVFESLP